MRVTFYIPEEKTNIKYQFAELAEKNGTSYSKLIVEFMENYINNKTKTMNVTPLKEYFNYKMIIQMLK